MRNWVLPEYIEDILPLEARRIESLRAQHFYAARLKRQNILYVFGQDPITHV